MPTYGPFAADIRKDLRNQIKRGIFEDYSKFDIELIKFWKFQK